MNIKDAFLIHLKVLTQGYYDGSATYKQENHPKERNQLKSASFMIENPLETKHIEGIPDRNIPSVCSVEQGEFYFQDLINIEKGLHDYNYGERLVDQVSFIIEKFKNGYSNNAQILVIDTKDHALENRPCLQLIDFKRLPDSLLDMHVIFRSLDIFALPVNLIGLSYLFEYIAELTNLKVNHLYCYSSGLNIRSDMMDMGKKIAKCLQY